MPFSFLLQVTFPCPAALCLCSAPGSPREAAIWGKDQIFWGKRDFSPLRKGWHTKYLGLRLEECAEKREGAMQTTES